MGRLLFLVFGLVGCSSAYTQSVYSGRAPDSIWARASTRYANPSFVQRLLLGSNYRTEWQTAVVVPVFRLRQMGFSIIELGGGMQTKSLRLQDKTGKGWVLRTVEKNIKPNLPPLLQNTFAEYVVQDMISAAHPYAPLTIPPLAKTIRLAVPDPVLYYVPSDPDLEPYRNIFANSLCFLEEREPTPDNSETKSTVEVLEKLIKTNDNRVAQDEVLKARLLDMLLGDWDRHADQWRWASSDTAGQKYYYAIPRDRDQATVKMTEGLNLCKTEMSFLVEAGTVTSLF